MKQLRWLLYLNVPKVLLNSLRRMELISMKPPAEAGVSASNWTCYSFEDFHCHCSGDILLGLFEAVTSKNALGREPKAIVDEISHTIRKINGIEVEATPKAPWSMDANFMHISYESGVLEDPAHVAPESLYKMTRGPKAWPEKPTILEVEFVKGLPVAVIVDKKKTVDPVGILELLNRIGGENGIGRIDIVENRFVGLKAHDFVTLLQEPQQDAARVEATRLLVD
uniref:argininosuccinate synthase n=1 Tax=Phlebotomus papatasi TaxID=29031 RepID=A0A1B0D5G5_PHLPP